MKQQTIYNQAKKYIYGISQNIRKGELKRRECYYLHTYVCTDTSESFICYVLSIDASDVYWGYVVDIRDMSAWEGTSGSSLASTLQVAHMQ